MPNIMMLFNHHKLPSLEKGQAGKIAEYVDSVAQAAIKKYLGLDSEVTDCTAFSTADAIYTRNLDDLKIGVTSNQGRHISLQKIGWINQYILGQLNRDPGPIPSGWKIGIWPTMVEGEYESLVIPE